MREIFLKERFSRMLNMELLFWNVMYDFLYKFIVGSILVNVGKKCVIRVLK